MNETGTKLACEVCGAQAVVTKGGDGELQCHGRPMRVVAGATSGPRPAPPPESQHDDPFYS